MRQPRPGRPSGDRNRRGVGRPGGCPAPCAGRDPCPPSAGGTASSRPGVGCRLFDLARIAVLRNAPGEHSRRFNDGPRAGCDGRGPGARRPCRRQRRVPAPVAPRPTGSLETSPPVISFPRPTEAGTALERSLPDIMLLGALKSARRGRIIGSSIGDVAASRSTGRCRARVSSNRPIGRPTTHEARKGRPEG